MDTTIDDYRRRIGEIRERRHELHEEIMEQMSLQFAAPYKSPGYEAAEARIEAINAQRHELDAESTALWGEWDKALEYRVSGFTRPTGRFIEPLNRLLGALPRWAKVIEPTSEAIGGVRSYRLLAFVTALMAATLLVGMTHFMPWLGVSPFGLMYAGFETLLGSARLAILATIATSVLVIKNVGFSVARTPTEGKFWDKWAMFEEQWFRMGAESWTVRQRITSCAAFGLVHVFNIIYPIASILVVGALLGGMAMVVYLDEFRRTGDTDRATLAAAKFHGTYNRFAVIYMVVALGLVLGYSFLT